MSLNESDLLYVILYGNKNFGNSTNISILTEAIKFYQIYEGFNQPLFFKKSVVLQIRFLPLCLMFFTFLFTNGQ